MAGTGKMASGAVTYMKGKLQRAIGRMTGNNKTKAKGMANQAKGGAKYGTGKVQKKVGDTLHD